MLLQRPGQCGSRCCAAGAPARRGVATAARPAAAAARRGHRLRTLASSQPLDSSSSGSGGSAGPQPLGDLALGAGRLVSKAIESVTNPKESKHAQRQKAQQQRQQRQEREEEEQAAEQQAAEQQAAERQQLQAAEQLAAAEAAALVDPLAAALSAGDAAEAAAAAAAVPEARAVSEYTEELVEVVEAPKTLAQRGADARAFLTATPTGRSISIAAGLFLGATFLIALYRTWQKYSSPRAQRMRVIDKNKLLVAELSQYLPNRRSDLTPAVIRKLRGATGFSPVEVFRKYLWFLLRERQFDAAAVEDCVLLKTALGLSDEQVAEALHERAARIYDKYGTLMLNVEGMTPEGVERKATCRALFSKLLYLTEHEPLVAQGSEAFKATDLRTIFGATDEDVEKLRIVSLYEVDLERLDAALSGADEPGAGGGEPGSSGGDKQQQ